MTVRSNPPGALLYVDDYEIGDTPVSVNFTYHGTRKIRLVKDGYETLTVMQSIPPPWYEYPPIDFVTENFIPGKIRDLRCLDFQLKPQLVVPTEQLLSRAEELRRGVHATTNVAGPPGAVVGPPPGTEIVPTPQGVGGQPVHPLPPSNKAGAVRRFRLEFCDVPNPVRCEPAKLSDRVCRGTPQ